MEIHNDTNLKFCRIASYNRLLLFPMRLQSCSQLISVTLSLFLQRKWPMSFGRSVPNATFFSANSVKFFFQSKLEDLPNPVLSLNLLESYGVVKSCKLGSETWPERDLKVKSQENTQK